MLDYRMTMEERDYFWLGINYFPARKAMYWWKSFELDEVEADFCRIRGAGFDLVRIFLMWEDFQPEPGRVSKRALANLKSVVDLALETEVQLMVTLYTGHMSGVNWIPAWAVSGEEVDTRFRVYSNGRVGRLGIKNWYDDEEVISSQEFLACEVACLLKDQVWAWDLGNENSNCAVPPSTEKALRWLERMTKAIRRSSNRPITVGLHAEDLEEDRKLGPFEVSQFCDFLCMHGYPIYLSYSEGPTDAFVLPFLGLVTKWLGGGKGVFFEEFGLPNIPSNVACGFVSLSEDETADFVSEALRLLYGFDFLGAMLWCYSDYVEGLWSKPPFDELIHERHFGAWFASDNNLREKKVVERVRRFKEEAGKLQKVKESFDWIDIEPTEFYGDRKKQLQRLYKRFRRFYGF